MVVELLELLKHAEKYECCWRDGELYVRPVVGPSAERRPDQLEAA